VKISSPCLSPCQGLGVGRPNSIHTLSLTMLRHSLFVGRTKGLDKTNVDDSGRRSERRTVGLAGPTPTFASMGCSHWSQPMLRIVNPLSGKTTNWRAGCGRTARPFRREGGSGIQPILPTPFNDIDVYTLREEDEGGDWRALFTALDSHAVWRRLLHLVFTKFGKLQQNRGGPLRLVV